MQSRYAVVPVMRTDEGYTISDQTLGLVWGFMFDEGHIETVFYNGAIKNVGDFIAYMRRDDVYPVVVFDVEEKKFTALAWVNNLNEGTAQCHFCTFNGGDPIIMGHEVHSYWRQFPSEVLGLIIGIVPGNNKAAINFGERLGMITIGEIPNYCNTVYLESRSPGVVMYKELGG